MENTRVIWAFLLVMLWNWSSAQQQNCDAVPNFKVGFNQYSIRELNHPTLAQFDFLLYSQSPFRYSPEKPAFIAPQRIQFEWIPQALKLIFTSPERQKLFQGLSSCLNGLAPIPLKNRLEQKGLPQALFGVIDSIERYKWADSSVFHSYQKVEGIWQIRQELWLEIELSPWVNFLPQVQDLDGDGLREFFVQVPSQLLSQEALTWIQKEYSKNRLTPTDVLSQMKILASYWYPTFNTDLELPAPFWPNTEQKTVLKSKNITKIKNPLVVMKGNPYGQKLYQIITYKGFSWPDSVFKNTSQSTHSKVKYQDFDLTHTPSYQYFSKPFLTPSNTELASAKCAQIQNTIQSFLKQFPSEQMAFADSTPRLHFRKELDFLAACHINQQDSFSLPTKALKRTQELLKQNGVHFVVVPIPPKTQIYPEALLKQSYHDTLGFASQKYFKELMDLGIDVLDVSNSLLQAKNGDSSPTDGLYQNGDTHLTARGFIAVANPIIEKIKSYPWYDQIEHPLQLQMQATQCLRKGDLIERLPLKDQSQWHADTLAANQFLVNGQPYAPTKGSPILIIGDSHTGVFESTDALASGLPSHIAFGSQLPIDLITSWGGGPLVAKKMFKHRKNELKNSTQLVILILAARDFWHYDQGWEVP